jgi:hypothetical protein
LTYFRFITTVFSLYELLWVTSWFLFPVARGRVDYINQK